MENPACSTESLWRAAHDGHLLALSKLIVQMDSLDGLASLGSTASFAAAARGHADCLAALLASGASPTRTNGAGRTPLHAAAMIGSAPCVRWLLRAKADVNATDAFGATALHLAVSADPARVPANAQLECVERLLAGGADRSWIAQAPAGDAMTAATSAELRELLAASDKPGWKPRLHPDDDCEQEAKAFAAFGSAVTQAASSDRAGRARDVVTSSTAPQARPTAEETHGEQRRQLSPSTTKPQPWRPALYRRQDQVDLPARLEAATAAHHRLQTLHVLQNQQQKILRSQQQQQQQQRPPWRPALQRTQHETHHAFRRAYPSGQVLRSTGAGAGTTTYGYTAARRLASSSPSIGDGSTPPPPDEHWFGELPLATRHNDGDADAVDAAAYAADAATTFERLLDFAEARKQHAGPATRSRPGGPRRAGEPLTVGDVRDEIVDPAASATAVAAARSADHRRDDREQAYDDDDFEDDTPVPAPTAAAEAVSRRPADPASFAGFD